MTPWSCFDIAGPVAAVEEFHGLVGKRLCRHAVTGRHFRKDMVGNDFHIFHPLPQGGTRTTVPMTSS